MYNWSQGPKGEKVLGYHVMLIEDKGIASRIESSCMSESFTRTKTFHPIWLYSDLQ